MKNRKRLWGWMLVLSMVTASVDVTTVSAAINNNMSTEKESVVKEAQSIKEERIADDKVYHILSFSDEISNIIPSEEKPELNEILEILPGELEITCFEDTEPMMLPVSWECVGDYEDTSYYFYQFLPVWDEAAYAVDESVQVPYFGLMLGEGAFNTLAVTSNGNETIIYNFLRGQLGCNTATAVGILANIFSESSFNPTASVIDTNGLTSYGICQWNGSRFTALKNYCSQNGYDYRSVTGQLNYLKYELNTTESRAWSYMQGIEDSANGAYTAGYRWAQHFERCASVYYEGRGVLARDTYWPAYGSADTEAPVISNVQITDVSVTGYTVTCTVTDNVGVTSVKFPTWPSATGSWDPPVWHEGTISGNTASCRINVSEHGNMVNMNYATHIYAYDAAGNRGWSGSDWVFIDGTAPEIKDVEVTDISEQGYTITCTVTDNIGIDRVQFPTWTIYNDQDDIDTNWQNSTFSQGKISESTVTYRVNTSDHNNEKGNYCTHIYVYDKHGNYTVRWLEIAVGKESVASTARREYKGHVYMLYDEGWGWTWTQAKSYCSSLGGHLATITSEEEQRIIEELLEEGSREYYWLGATDEMVEGDWQWVTGEEFAYTNWADTQPDNYNTTEHYLVAYNDAAIRGLWNDVPERVGYGFICEIDGPEEFIITFDVNGGEPLANSTLNLTHESVNVSLPIPTRNGYVFEGWFDAREGGSKVTSIDQPTSDRVLYAQWTVQSGTEPHVHNYERTIAKDATCMEAGMAAYICSGCNDQYTEEIPALGHEWDNGQVTRKASCTEVGIMTYTCRRCGEIHTEELPASDHGGATVLKFEKKATCTVDGYSGDTYCVECGKLLEIGTVVPAAGHQWNEGVVVQEVTNTSDGLKIYTCNVCGTSKKEIIKAAGENSKPDPATPQPGIPEKPTVTVGMTVQDTGSGGVYKVTGSGTAVEFVKPINAKKKAVTVPNTIVVNGVTCKVTSIAAKAFKGNKTLTKVTIPSNIKSIGKQAFFGCKKLKSITIKTKLLTSKTVGSKAFKGIYAKVTVKVPKNKRKAYKTLLKSKGVDNKAKFK